MRIRKIYYLDEQDDSALIEAIRDYGVNRMGKDIGCTLVHMSKWINGHGGMGEHLFDAVCERLGIGWGQTQKGKRR